MKKVLALVLSLVVVLAGCSTNWVAQAEQIIAALVPAAANIIALVTAFQGKGIDADQINLVNASAKEATADLEVVKALIEQYNSAPDADKAAVLDKINAALQSASDHLGSILAAFHVKDQTLQAKIVAVVNLSLSEIQSLKALVPLVKNPKLVKSVKAPLSAKQFKKAYNHAADAVAPGFHI